jgi:hypothetical protein
VLTVKAIIKDGKVNFLGQVLIHRRTKGTGQFFGYSNCCYKWLAQIATLY